MKPSDEMPDVASVAVVCGGSSAEAAVSRVSGKCVFDALRSRFPKTTMLELTPSIIDELRRVKADVVFPALHGPPGEDGCFQGVLELLGIPYVGSGVLASALAMSKHTAKQVLQSCDVPVPMGMHVRRAGANETDRIQQFCSAIRGGYVVKPAHQGSAIGVHFCDSYPAVEEAIQNVFRLDDCALIEERIIGAEVTVAVLDDGPDLPPIEIVTPSGSWYDYSHRYTAGLSEHLIPARISEAQRQISVEYARKAHEALGCRDLSRVDMIVPSEGNPRVLEVNTLPGMTPTSLFPDAAKHVGISFEELTARLVIAAVRRKTTGRN
jgi:D-alanine-D-alanine ligase